mgnify:CR=1 FL=1
MDQKLKSNLVDADLEKVEQSAMFILKQELAQAGFAGMREYLRSTRGARLAGAGATARVETFGDRIVVELGGAKFVWIFGIEA